MCGKFNPSSPLYTPPATIPCLSCGGDVDPETGCCKQCGAQVFKAAGVQDKKLVTK
jgi:predicted amidophosphoribosyltransferase